jgi:hypothetical protein
MNLPVSRTLLSFFFLFSLFSCDDDPTEIGLELQESDNQIGTHFKDDFQINTSTVLLKDSIVSFGSRPVLAGRVSDGDFGTISARTFAEVSLPSNNLKFDANTGADSLVLSLGYTSYFGDTTAVTSLSVYELDTVFSEKRTYFTTTSLPTKSTPLGSVSFQPRPTGTRPAGSASTTARSTPTVKIRLSTELADRILAQSEKPALANQQAFVEQLLKGISLAPTPGSAGGAVLGFNLQSDSTYLSLYYTSGTTKKRVKFPFLDVQPRFNQISVDRSGTPLAGLVNSGDIVPSGQTGDVTYLQSGTGLRTKITFTEDLSALKALGTVAINRAELVVPVQKGLFDKSAVPPLVYLYETNETNRILTANDGTTPRRVLQRGSPAELVYNADKKEFSANITSYVQGLVYSTATTPKSLLISSSVNGNLINRATLSASPTDRVRLRVYYSVVSN